MMPAAVSEQGRFPARKLDALWICLAVVSWYGAADCRAQVTAFSSRESLSFSGSQSKTQEQLLEELSSARQMLSAHPSAHAYVLVGRVLNALGEIEAASKFFDRAIEVDPHFPEGWFEQGRVIAGRGDWSGAAESFRHALSRSPNYASAHLALGEMLLRSGEFDASRAELDSVLRIDPNSAGAYQGLGLIDLQQGRAEAAENQFRKALKIRPDYQDAQRGLAHALAYQQRWSEAVVLLRVILEANPDSTEDTSSLATALANRGDKPGAAEQFARARELSEKELRLLRAKGDSNMGVSLRDEGKLQEAAAAFRRALNDDSDFCDAHDDLGEVLWLEKDLAGALSEFQIAIRCDPASALAKNNLGSALLYYKHDVDQAIEQLHSAVAARPGFALAHLNLGKALAAKKEFENAESELRCAITIDPALAAAHVNLGLVLATKSGRVSKEAQEEMEQGLRLDPRLREVIPTQYQAMLR